MRILEVVPHLGSEASGPTYSVVALSRALAEAGHQVMLLSVNGHVPGAPGFEHRALGEARFPPGLGLSRRFAVESMSIARETSLVHAHGLWSLPSVYADQAAHRAGTPLLISPRGCLSAEALRRSSLRKRAFWALFYRGAFGRSRCLHATSDREYQDIRAFGLTNPVAILPNGVEPPPPGSISSHGPRDKSVLFLGRIHPIKGLDVLLAAWKEALRGGLSGWSLRMVGPGDPKYIEGLQQLAESLGIEASVRFLPAAFGDAKWREYGRASISILPSRTENFGMTVAGSLARGTPVIASTGTPWEGLAREGCGWWVDLTPDALARALTEATRTASDDLAAMGNRGRTWMKRSFSWPAIASDMVRVYEWVVGGGAPPECVRVT